MIESSNGEKVRLDFNWEGILMFSFDCFTGRAFKTKKSSKKLFVIPQTMLHHCKKTLCSSEISTTIGALRVYILGGPYRCKLSSLGLCWYSQGFVITGKSRSKRITALIRNLVKGPKGHLLTLSLCIQGSDRACTKDVGFEQKHRIGRGTVFQTRRRRARGSQDQVTWDILGCFLAPSLK